MTNQILLIVEFLAYWFGFLIVPVLILALLVWLVKKKPDGKSK